MEQLQRITEPYRHFDPLGWVGVFRFLPVWGGVVAALFGLVMMFFGGRQLFRLVAGPVGALLAMVWAAPLAQRLGFGANARQVALVATIALLGSGLLWPPVVVFFAFGVPAGLLGGQLVGANDWILGFGPGFLLGGAAGLALHRVVGAVLSAAAGAWVLVLGAMAALNPFVGAIGWFASNPVAVLTLAGILGLAGATYQLFVRPSEEDARAQKQERELAKRRAKEQQATEARWAKYNNEK